MATRAEHEMARLFAYDHLPEHLQVISRPFAQLAEDLMYGTAPQDPLIHQALMKLWEAKNLVVLTAARPG